MTHACKMRVMFSFLMANIYIYAESLDADINSLKGEGNRGKKSILLT